MKSIHVFLLVFILTLILGGCANYPLVDEAKSSYEQASNDPDVVAQAPNALKEAEEQLNTIENLKKNGAGKTLINHHAYIAQQKVAIAYEVAVLNARQDQLAKIEKEQQMLLADLQREEALKAERMAQKARKEAEEARRRSELLATQLSELEAEQTERGLVVNLQNVLFDFGTASIKPGSAENLAKLYRFLIEYPERKILIEGFTDSVGPENVNKKLSEQRAQAVKQVLVESGIAPNRIMTRGYGEEYPIADNSTAAGRQQNRRVEVVISDGQGTITERQRIQ